MIAVCNEMPAGSISRKSHCAGTLIYDEAARLVFRGE
jgi:hypothetical protein